MKNKVVVLIITLLIIINTLAGCNNTYQSSAISNGISNTNIDPSSVIPEPTQSDKSPMVAYKNVLQGKVPFYCTDAQKELYISQLNQAVSSDSSVEVKATKFSIIDLDNDGIAEVILWLSVNSNDYFGFEVLHYQDGEINGYTLWYRSFMELKEDGTFSFSSGASESGYGIIAFTKDGYTIDKITYSEVAIDSDNNETISYFVNRTSASSEEFQSAVTEQSKKADASWYDFTDENIEKFF